MVWSVGDVEGLEHDETIAPDVPGAGAICPGSANCCPTTRSRRSRSGTTSTRSRSSSRRSGRRDGPRAAAWQEWLRFLPTATFDDPWVDATRCVILVDLPSWPSAHRPHAWKQPRFMAPTLDLNVAFHAPTTGHEWLLCDGAAPLSTGGLFGWTARIWSAGRPTACIGRRAVPLPPRAPALVTGGLVEALALQVRCGTSSAGARGAGRRDRGRRPRRRCSTTRSTSPPNSATRAQRRGDVVDRQRDVREAGLVHRPRAERLGLARGGEVQELEHEAVAHEIGGGHPERRRQRHELRRALVGRVDLALEREAEQLAVEPLRPLEVGDALAHVVERRSWRRVFVTRSQRRCLSSLVRQRPVARSNCQWCRLHVSTPSSISPKRVRSAWRCGQKRSIRQPSRSKNSSACARRSRYAAFDVVDALGRQRLEERHHELVEVRGVGPVPDEPARQEQRVHPVLDVAFEQRLDEPAVDVDLVDVRLDLALPRPHLRLDEVDADVGAGFADVDHDVARDARRRDRRAPQQRLEPRRELADEIAPPCDHDCVLGREPRRPVAAVLARGTRACR